MLLLGKCHLQQLTDDLNDINGSKSRKNVAKTHQVERFFLILFFLGPFAVCTCLKITFVVKNCVMSPNIIARRSFALFSLQSDTSKTLESSTQTAKRI